MRKDRGKREIPIDVGRIERILRSSRPMKSDGKKQPGRMRALTKTRRGVYGEGRQ